MLIECVAAGPGQLDGFAESDVPVLACKFDDLKLQFRQGRQYDLLALDLLLQASNLLGQGAQ